MMKSNRLVEASLQTDQGLLRDHNEDFVSAREPISREDENNNGWLYIVADGVGGADAGEVASQFASERTVEHYLNNKQMANWGERLRKSMQSANTDLRQLVAERNDHSRMATTMVAAVIRDHHAFIANVGDSRCYHFSQGELYQVTKDQSLVAKLVEEGAITEAEAEVHPRKNVILYSLGSEREPQIDLFERPLEPGDILLLCSDGLTRHVSNEELGTIVSHQEPAIATQTLIQLAISRGGEDNISVAVLQYNNTEETSVGKRAETGAAHLPIRGRTLLWSYTILLSLVQSFLIFLVWLALRV
jgi:serine/threonine protein phosphatase PrpC